MKKFDVVIIGSGPAGSSAATILGQYGHRVLLLDKERFPRDKTCGDGITYKALPALSRLGLENRIKSESPFKTNGYTLVFRDLTRLVYEKPASDNSLAYIISRHQFDQMLLENALKHPSIHFMPDIKVTDAVYQNGQITGVVIDGKPSDFTASVFIDATGANSVLGKENKDPRACALAVRGYYSQVTDLSNTIEVYFSDDILPGYFWIFPTSSSTANIGGGTFQNIIEDKKILIKDVVLDFVQNHPIASKKLKNAKLEGILKGGKIPLAFGDFNWSRVRNNLVLIGDAGGFVNPITAEGISYAMKSGIYAADSIHAYLTSNDKNLAHLKTFDELCMKEFAGQYKMGDLFTHGIEKDVVQKYVMASLVNSMYHHDLKDPADSYEYLVRLKVLTKSFG